MSDAFVPEADRMDQDREVGPPLVEDDDARALADPRDRPVQVPWDAPEADVLEQSQEIIDDGYE